MKKSLLGIIHYTELLLHVHVYVQTYKGFMVLKALLKNAWLSHLYVKQKKNCKLGWFFDKALYNTISVKLHVSIFIQQFSNGDFVESMTSFLTSDLKMICYLCRTNIK